MATANVSRRHRTAAFFDGTALGSNEAYRERANRLVASLNGPNIKVDVYTVFGTPGHSGIVAGLVTDVPPSAGGFDAAAIEAIGRDAGYVQTLVVFPTK